MSNPTIVIIIWIDKTKQILTTTESRAAIEKKLKLSLSQNEISNYLVYSLENYLKFYKKSLDK